MLQRHKRNRLSLDKTIGAGRRTNDHAIFISNADSGPNPKGRSPQRQARLLALALMMIMSLLICGLLVGCGAPASSGTAASRPATTIVQATNADSSGAAPTTATILPAVTTKTAAAGMTTGTTTASPSTSAPASATTLPAGEVPSAAHPVIALTFDDGPSLRDTGKLLDLLKAEQVPATFFVLGSQIDAGRQGLVQRAFNEGHEIGNHTYSHLTLRKVSADKVRDELTKTSNLIAQLTGRKPTIARPPTGAYDDTTVAVCKELGLALVNWSYQSCPEDWNHRGEPQYIADFVVSKAANGHIVLLHDVNASTMEAMPAMIKGLKARGFRFMTVSQMLAYAGAGEPAPGKVYFQYSVKK